MRALARLRNFLRSLVKSSVAQVTFALSGLLRKKLLPWEIEKKETLGGGERGGETGRERN